MNQSLTVVLPIHNAESTLRASVDRVLEIAGDLTPSFEVLIVDDGSTDDSFDIAREVAARYPQVRVMRQPRRRGLGPTLNDIRRRVKSDIVMVHDGVSTTNAEQLRALWERRVDAGQPSDVSIADLLRPSQNHAAMEKAHRRLSGFHLLSNPSDAPPATSANSDAAPAPHHRVSKQKDVGAIPSLPRPNFVGAVSDFAMGE